MFRFMPLIIAAVITALPVRAQEASDPGPPDAPAALVITEAGDLTLDEFKWLSRLVVVFADSPDDPRFVQQMDYIAERPEALAARDVVVITDTDPAAKSAIRTALRPRGFDLVLIGKDGMKYLRKPFAWDIRELSRSIDKMPLRQQELRDAR